MVPLRYAVALAASLFFGLAIVPDWGGFTYLAITWVICGMIAAGWLYRSAGAETSRRLPVRWVAPAVFGGVVALSAYTAWAPEPFRYAQRDWSLGRAALWGVFVLISTHGFSLRRLEARWVRALRFTAIAALVAQMGMQTIIASPAPEIDVWTVQQEGAAVLASGKNPFQDVRLKDIGPRTANDVPYVYPPLHLYVSAASWALLGDVRYAMVLALVLAGFATRALAVRASGGTFPAILEDAPALLIWCTPKGPFILEQGWIDPVPLFWFSALLLLWHRPWVAAVLAGLVVGGKQTMLLVVVPVGLALGFTLPQWVLAGAVTLGPLMPWLLWDFRAWKHSNFDFLSALPVRDGALTLVTWAKRRLHLTLPPVTAFISAALVIGWHAWRRRTGRDRAAIASLAAMTCFFVFNKWAFANYYFTLLGLAALTAAASLLPQDEVTAAAPPP